MTAEEEHAVMSLPAGHRFTLLWISYLKHALVSDPKMPAGYRLRFLEWIDDQRDTFIASDIIEMIEPMSATEVEMMHAAQSLGGKDDPGGQASFKVLTSADVFADFLKLNPSMLAAIVKCNSRWNTTPAPTVRQSEKQNNQQYISPAARNTQWAAKQFNPMRIT
jgi:hypothetical protein